MAAQLISTSQGQTLILTLSNPEHRNALGPEMYAAGVEALNAAESNPELRSVIITGAGGIFSAGGNLQRLQNNRQQPPEVQAQSIEGLHSWIEAIRTFPKPVIAAVEGPAAGAGFSLALACDLIVAAHNSVFVMAYSSIALSPDGGGSWSLSRRRAHRRRAGCPVGPGLGLCRRRAAAGPGAGHRAPPGGPAGTRRAGDPPRLRPGRAAGLVCPAAAGGRAPARADRPTRVPRGRACLSGKTRAEISGASAALTLRRRPLRCAVRCRRQSIRRSAGEAIGAPDRGAGAHARTGGWRCPPPPPAAPV